MHKELRITNETRNLSLVRRILSDFMAHSPFPLADQSRLILAIDEAIANVVEHAYGTDRGLIHISFDLETKRLVVSVCDHGHKFQPHEIQPPDLKEHLRLGRKSGLGMVLMRRVMDEIQYSTTTNYVNHLSMIKYFPSQDTPQQNEFSSARLGSYLEGIRNA